MDAGPVGLDRIEMFAHGLDHAEGIAIAADGTIYVGGEAGQIYRIGADDSIEEVVSTNGFMLGLAADGEGSVYACDGANMVVWRIDPGTRRDGGLLRRPPGPQARDPELGCFAAEGTYYFSESGDWKERTGSVWRVPPGGQGARSGPRSRSTSRTAGRWRAGWEQPLVLESPRASSSSTRSATTARPIRGASCPTCGPPCRTASR